jgi:cytochrome P450
MTIALSRDTELTAEQTEARDRIYALPLAELDPANPDHYPSGDIHFVFERLRAEDPVHFTAAEHTRYNDYWSLTTWADIQTADTDHESFSAEGQINLNRPPTAAEAAAAFNDGTMTPEQMEAIRVRGSRSLLSMDPPDHEIHRGAVSEGVSPANLAAMEPLIRERAGAILDSLPIGVEFDWVDKVSIELTAMTLATLFDYPQEKRRQLTHWSNIFTSDPGPGMPAETQADKDRARREFFVAVSDIINRRRSEEPRLDFLSLMAHSPHSKDFTDAELLGDAAVLLIGGNDTTRNTISGSVYALSTYTEQNAKLRANPALIPSMISETIRWQTPLTRMSRIATRDVEIHGTTIPKGSTVALWYVSGNRDEAKVENPTAYIIDRKNPRHHLSFGFGIHRCLGNKLAELQLRIIWEEMLARFPEINVIGEPVRSHHNFIKGYERMTVVLPRRN